jgi:hypothetical protein
MATSSSQEIARLNNNASALIDEGNYSAAVSKLSPALTMNQVFNEEFEPNGGMRGGNSQQAGLDFLQECMGLQGMTGERSSPSQRARSYPRGEGGPVSCDDNYIYRRPIRLPEEASKTYHDYSCNFVTFSVATIFNSALAHHLSGLEESTPNAKRAKLGKSLSLYALSQKLLAQEEWNTGSLLLILVITNNMGQACTTLGHTYNANAMFGRMLPTLLYLTDIKYEDSQFPLEGFYQNIIHSILTKSHTAEAA